MGRAMEARRLLDEAAREWRAGRHYEAHEVLEDVAECFEADDPSFDIALALAHVAAGFHKIIHDVGAKAAPNKIKRALDTLEDAPADWLGLDFAAFVEKVRAVHALLQRGERVTDFPSL